MKNVSFAVSIPPSVNHAYENNGRGGRILTQAAKDWKEEAYYVALQAKNKAGWRIPGKAEKLILALWVFWPDKRKRDTHNLHKLIADAFEGVLYENDRQVLIRDMDFAVDRQRPRVEVELCRKTHARAAAITEG